MKKGSKLLFAYFSTLVMLVGFFLPNFTYFVSATEVDANDNLLKSEEVTFSNVTDGVLNLDMEENKSVDLTISDENYEIVSCYSTDYNGMLTASVDEDGKTCKVVANDYGKTDLAILYKDSTALGEIDYHTKVVSVDVDFEKYFNFFLNSIPEEVEYYENYYHNLPYDLNMPDNFYIEPLEDSCYSVTGNTCTLELQYRYYKYNGAENMEATYVGTKDVILVDKDSDNDYFLSSGYVQIGIGDEKDFDIYPSYNINEYFWVSSDNTVAMVNTANRIVGVGPGTAEIMLIHKETLEVKVDYFVEVDSIYANREIDQVLNVFKDTVVIDISNDLGYYHWYDGLDSLSPVKNYFDKLATNTNYYATNITCAEGLNDCQIAYKSYGSDEPLTTQYFNVSYVGVNVERVIDAHTSFDDLSFVYLNDEITLTGITSTEGTIRVSYDDTMLEQVEGQEYTFKTLQEGFTTITLYLETESGSGYMTNINLYILFTEEDVTTANETLSNLNEIVIPFNPEGMSNQTMTDLFKGIVEDSLLDSAVYPYLELEVKALPDYNFSLSARVVVLGRYISVLNISNKIINGLFDSEGEVVYPEVEEILDKVKSNYKLTVDQSINLLTSSNTSDELYNGLLEVIGLGELESDKFELNFYYLTEYAYNDYLIAGTDFALEIYYQGQYVARKDFFVAYDFVLSREVTEDASAASKLTYVKNYINDLGIDATVTNAFDNYYLVENDNLQFYLLLDQKDKIVAQDVVFDANNTDLKVGEVKQLKYALRPFGATYADITFKSSDERVVKVDDKGVLTGVSKGYAFVRMSYQGNYQDIFVTVGYTDNSFFDEMVEGLNLSYEIPYSILNEYDGEIGLAIYSVACDRIDKFINSLKGNLENSDSSSYGLIPGWISYEITNKEDGPEDELYLVLSTGNHTSNYYPIEYKLVGIDVKDEIIDIDSNETVDIDVTYSEGDIRDLRYYIYNPEIISIKNNKITGLKTGYTYVDVYDKYNKYTNSFTVYVNGEDYVVGERDKLSNVVVKLTGSDINGYNIHNVTQLSNPIFNYLVDNNIDYEAALGNYDFLEYAFDEETMKFTINAMSWEFGLSDSVVIQLQIDGLYLGDSTIVEIGKNETFTADITKYGDAANATVTAKSNDTSICTVDGLTVTTLNSGICKVTYTANNDSIVQYFKVDTEGITNELNEMLNLVDDTISLKMDEYDFDRENEMLYNDYYESYLNRYFANIYDDFENVYFNIDYPFIKEDNSLDFSLMMHYPYKFKTFITHDSGFYSDNKNVKLTYAGVTSGYDEVKDEVLDAIDEYYELDDEEYLDFLINADDYTEFHKYSGLMKDIKSVCEDCEVYVHSSGFTEPPNGKIEPVTTYILYKNGEPIGDFDVRYRYYLQLDLYEIEDDTHIQREITNRIKKAYNDYLLNQSIVAFNTSDASDDIDIKVSRSTFDFYSIDRRYNYDITIGDTVIQTSVYINIIKKVEEIKVNKDILNLEVGDTENLTATVSPSDAYNKNIKWSSSNEKVVTVKDGKVTAIGSGNAVITVESEDGYAKATINVSVIDPKVTGDIDGDGKVNIVDLVQLRKHLAGITTLKGDALKGADVNKDGKVNILDLVKIRKHLAGLEVIK